MDEMISPADKRIRSTVSKEAAIERVVSFAQEFGEKHLTLACHAAFPLALTPDLLYQIWANFVPQAPWTAVADVLLSPLCSEVGYELYEMEVTVRNLLLRELKGDQDFGQQRLNDLASFLTEYVTLRFDSEDPEARDLARNQRWTALAYTQPGKAARELAQALLGLGPQSKSDLLRTAALVETLADPLAQFGPLLAYTRGITNLARGDRKLAEAQLVEALGRTPQITVAGMNLPIPKWVLSGIDPYEPEDLITRSQYVVAGPASDEMFFGREDILQEIAANINRHSYALTGGRRIGKTSILLQLHRNTLPAAGFQTVYYDCSTTQTHESFLSAEIRSARTESLSPQLKTLGDLLKSPPAGGQLVLLLDEADMLVSPEVDAGWPLFSQLRAASQKGKIQFVFSAYRPFQESLRNPENPLFNFVKELNVGLLDAQAVKALVTQPMQELGIELVDETDIVGRIRTFTSGHPNLVQRLCRRLVEQLVEHDIRSITSEDVGQIIQNPRFLRDDYLSIYWQGATPLEKIISLLMAANDAHWTPKTVQQVVEKHCGIPVQYRQISEALERLTGLRYILKRKGKEYVFAARAFPSVIKKVVDFEDLLESLKQEYRQMGDEDTLYGIDRAQDESSVIPPATVFNPDGPLTDRDVTYIERQGDFDVIAHLETMEYVEIVEPVRQGKTSLINHLMGHPQLKDFSFAYIDMTALDNSTSAAWYQSLCSRILRQLHFFSSEEYPPAAQSSFEWHQFLSYVGNYAMSAQRNIVIALDEIPVQIPDKTAFFSALRALYDHRAVESELNHITFLLAGTYHPGDLITDNSVSPFNIAYRVHLADFSQAEVRELVGKGAWRARRKVPELAERVYCWTNGQPYLTQLLCSHLEPDATPDDVDLCVEHLLRENRDLLYPVITQLENDKRLQGYVARIQAGERIKFYPREHQSQAQLEILGLIREDEDGFCTIKNRIYRRILERILPTHPALIKADRCLAVIVGVDKFVDATLPNLPVCVNDASAVHRILENEWYFNDIRLLVDEEATREGVLETLRKIAGNAQPSDLLLFYYSGHGIRRSDNSYIVTHDTRVILAEETAIPLEEIQGILGRSQARAKLTIIDTESDVSRLTLSENSAILASSSPGETSYVLPEANHSVFTNFLIEALRGDADIDKKGFVALNDLFRHISAKMKSWSAQRSAQASRGQTPFIRQSEMSNIVLIPNKAQTLIDLIETSDSKLPVVKHQAMEELARVDLETAKVKLAQWIVNPIAYEEWESAVQILQGIDSQAARDALIETLQHPDSGVRWNAASRLADIADRQSWKSLQRAFRMESGAALRSYLYELLTGNSSNREFIVDQHTAQFIQNVTPTEAERDELLNIASSLQHDLSRMSALEDAFLETQIFGSLARGTAVRPISDIDVLVLFRGRPTVEDPKLAYRILESALKRIYGGRVVDKKAILRNTSRRQRVFSSFGASIIVDLPQGWLEVLPAVTSNSQAERFFVPDRLLRNWVPTNHEIHAQSTRKREMESGGMYSSLVKAMKWWQHFQASGRKYLSGFVLECLVAAHIDWVSDSLLVSFGRLMRRIRKEYPTHRSMLRVPELGVPSGFKQTNLTKHRYYRLMGIIDETMKLTEQARHAESIDEELGIWHRVFGPEFPRDLS